MRSTDAEQAARPGVPHAWVVLLALLAAAAAARGTPLPAPSPEACLTSGEAEVMLSVPSPGDTLALPHRIVSREGFRLCQDSLCYGAGRDFRLLPERGLLIWLGAAPDAATPLVARYRYLPLPIAGRWRRHTGEAPPETLRLRPQRAVGAPELPPGARLEIGGSKTFTVEFGNRRDINLSQSLDLTLSGQLAEEVRVRAILTDRRTPLQPEGTTAELSDLDQVLVELDAPWGALRLGDIGVREEDFRFLSHRREMEGLQAIAHPHRSHSFRAALGRGQGTHRTLQRFGTDGKQGPYRLLESRPGDEAVIVAGSERVWLDDVRMQRGEDDDYVIDYGTGELWFMTRRPITAVSEIRVDFQVRQGAFERGYYSLAAASGDSTSGLSFSWLREGDDPDHSPLLPLGEEERAALAEAGDSVTAALAGGVVAVEPGEGDYALAESDTLDAPFFVYVGPGDPEDPTQPGGSYRVAFSDVGEGRGDYADSTFGMGEAIYYYVGHRRGRFLPGRRIPLPESLDLLALRGAQDLGSGLEIAAEGALSWNDRNTLSDLDDEDNAGHALWLQGNWALGELLGRRRDLVTCSFSLRDVDSQFVSPEPLDPPFYFRRWNASDASVLDGRDRRGRAAVAVRPTDRVQLAADWEALRAQERFRGDRWHLLAERRGPLGGRAEIWRSDATERGEPRRTERHEAALGWDRTIKVEASYAAEDLLAGAPGDESGEGYQLGALRASLPIGASGLTAAMLGRVRWDRIWRDGDADPNGRRRLYQVELDYSRMPTSALLVYSHRVTEVGDGGDQTADLVDWVAAHRAPRGLLSGEWRGRVTNEETRERVGQLVAVGPGAGHYDSLGSYVDRGDYEFYYVQTDSSALETRLESALRLTLRPFQLAAAGDSPLSGLETALYGRLEAAAPQSLEHLIGHAGRLLRGDAPVRLHDRLTRVDLSWKGPSGAPAPRLRWEERARRERTASGLGNVRRRTLAELELRWGIRSGLSVRTQLGAEREREGVETGYAGGAYVDQRDTRRGGGELTWKLFHPITLKSSLEGRREEFRPSATQRDLVSAALGVLAEFRRAGRLELTGERRWSDGETQGVPFLLARPGWNVQLTGSLRPTGSITSSLRLRVEREEGGRTVTSGRMEVRAFF